MSQIQTEDQQALANYLTMKISLSQYSTIFDALEVRQREALQPIIEQSVTLHHSILASDECSRISISPNQIKQAVAEVRSRFNTREEFLATLEANHMDEFQLAEALRLELLCDTTLDYVARHCKHISEQEAEVYYLKHMDKFSQPERRSARHILITINDEFEENIRSVALDRIMDIASQISTDQFGWFATRHSECPTAVSEGTLGQVEKGQLHPEMDECLFLMEPNTISRVIETEAGFHLLMCEQIHPAHTVPFSQAKAQIITRHLERERGLVQKKWMAEIKKDRNKS